MAPSVKIGKVEKIKTIMTEERQTGNLVKETRYKSTEVQSRQVSNIHFTKIFLNNRTVPETLRPIKCLIES